MAISDFSVSLKTPAQFKSNCSAIKLSLACIITRYKLSVGRLYSVFAVDGSLTAASETVLQRVSLRRLETSAGSVLKGTSHVFSFLLLVKNVVMLEFKSRVTFDSPAFS